jgi:hypothetical protein
VKRAWGGRAPQTTNLDGESNLKIRSAVRETKAYATDAHMAGFHGVVKCGPPDDKLYKFDSQLRIVRGPGMFLTLV